MTSPIPLATRQRMAAGNDRTVNAAGPHNECPPSPMLRDATTDLIDGLIRDGWIAPESREAEIAAMTQRQRDVLQRDLTALRKAIEAERDFYRAILARADEVAAQGEWQPIETAPKDGRWLLGFGNGPATERCSFIMEWDEDRGWIEIYSDCAFNPTHWMPLPPLPKEAAS